MIATCNVGSVPVEMLPEEVLLDIFDFYLGKDNYAMAWVTLVHVCRRWRSIVFAAPLRLDLRLDCSGRTPRREMLRIWPTLPIVVKMYGFTDEIEDEALAALECRDRVCKILAEGLSNHELKSLAEVTRQGTFPALRDLHIVGFGEVSVVPDLLLGGSSPGLRSLYLKGAVFPALGKLLLSTARLVDLSLCDIPDSVIINPQTMADWLPSLTGLVKLRIEYQNSHIQLLQIRLDQASERPIPLTRTVLPVLTTLTFHGGSYYLDLFSSFDAPLLKHVDMDFANPPILDFSKISQFIGHKGSFEAFDQAHVSWLGDLNVLSLWLSSRRGTTGGMWLKVSMIWKDRAWKLDSLEQIHRPFAPPLATHGYFDTPKPEDASGRPSLWSPETGYGQWLRFLSFLTAVEKLYLSEMMTVCLAPLLRVLSGKENAAIARDFLPVLQSVFVERFGPSGFSQGAIEAYVAARGASGHPVELDRWVDD
jgi:hypothetical protein